MKANKLKTIKNATDEELEELVKRLRKENELQYLIGDIKRKASPHPSNYDEPMNVSTEEPIESLYHYGIRGMRWGRRKSTSSKSNSRKSKKTENASDDYKKASSLKKKKLHELSNAELKDLNTRLQLEKSYRELNPKKINAGKKIANEILVGAAKQAASKALNKGVEMAIKKAINMK